MKKTFTGVAVAAATLAFATSALAAGPPYCGTHATPTITAPAAGNAAACQSAISKGTEKYVKSLLKTRGKCLLQGEIDACPNADDDAKVQAAAIKVLQKIATTCSDTNGLGTSYDGASGADAASCTLSQNHGTVEVFIGETHGTSGLPNANEARNTCQKAISGAAQKFLPAVLKAVDKCIAGKIKANTVATIGADCVGALAPGGLTAPTDLKTADAITKATEKMHGAIVKKCAGLPATEIKNLFGCPGATTEADLDTCVSCSGLNAVFEIVDQQYAETGTVVSPAANAIQTAVDGGSAGDKFLIASGDYDEDVNLPIATCTIRGGACEGDGTCGECAVTATDCDEDDDCETALCAVSSEDCLSNSDCSAKVCSAGSTNPNEACAVNGDCPSGTCDASPTNTCNGANAGNTCEPVPGDTCVSNGDGMKFVGCGAATDDRPRVLPPTLSPPLSGFRAVGVDGLHFQGLNVVGWANDGIFVRKADGVSFRDCYGDGDDQTTPAVIDPVSTYAFFPVESSNVTVEGCEVVNVRDAGIYVGSSEDILMRHNYVHGNVTGIEIENSENAVEYGNTAHDNTGGLLVFLLPGPPKQESGGHSVFDNVSYHNNTPNFGLPNTTVGNVPAGTGLMIISDNNSTFENNVIRDNGSYGILLVDQEAVNALVGPPPLFDPTSVDQDVDNLRFINNRLPSGAAVDTNGNDPSPGALGAANYTIAMIEGNGNGTCFSPVPSANQQSAPLGDPFTACP